MSALPPDLRVSAEVADRVRSVISEAEAAAGALRHEAEQHLQVRRRSAEREAERILDEARREAAALVTERTRRIAELSDELVERVESLLARFERAEEVREEVEALVDALGHSARALTEELRGSEPRRETPPEPVVATEVPQAVADDPVPEPIEEEPQDVDVVELHDPTRSDAPMEDGEDRFLAARLVALQMAVAGGSRGEVGEHLREVFDLGADANTILDDVFGAGSRAEDHVVWPEGERTRRA